MLPSNFAIRTSFEGMSASWLTTLTSTTLPSRSTQRRSSPSIFSQVTLTAQSLTLIPLTSSQTFLPRKFLSQSCSEASSPPSTDLHTLSRQSSTEMAKQLPQLQKKQQRLKSFSALPYRSNKNFEDGVTRACAA